MYPVQLSRALISVRTTTIRVSVTRVSPMRRRLGIHGLTLGRSCLRPMPRAIFAHSTSCEGPGTMKIVPYRSSSSLALRMTHGERPRENRVRCLCRVSFALTTACSVLGVRTLRASNEVARRILAGPLSFSRKVLKPFRSVSIRLHSPFPGRPLSCRYCIFQAAVSASTQSLP